MLLAVTSRSELAAVNPDNPMLKAAMSAPELIR
jgi:hypothetical protein